MSHKRVPERPRASALPQADKQSTEEQNSEVKSGDDTPLCKAIKMKANRKALQKILPILNYGVIKWHTKINIARCKDAK